MEDLPAELMIDILSRLPVKTIIHCKFVCKKWRNLVLDSSFVDLHLSRSPTGLIVHNKPQRSVYDYTDMGTLKWVEIEDEDDHHHLHHDPLMSLDLNLAPILQYSVIYLMGSVNGLICLRHHSPKVDNTYICNPVTREYVILPRPQQCREGRSAVTAYGFGVSSRTGDYKVVRATQQTPRKYVLLVPNGDEPSLQSVVEAEVYTLGTCQWRSLGRVPYLFNGIHGPFLNGHCHWIASDQMGALQKICTFDLDNETFQLFSSPPHESTQLNPGDKGLAVLKGCLCKIDTYDFEVMIWVMKEYGIKKSWHKEVVITQEISVAIQWSLPEAMSPIEVLKDGSILIFYEDKLWEFNPRSETMEDVKMFDSDLNGMAYRPSFIKLQNYESERVQIPYLIILIRPSMEDLPQDVMANILTRLPIMTIINCKCVCKKWRNLVLDSYFVNLHLLRSLPSLIVRCISRLDMRYPYKPGILKWVEIEDKLDRHHLHHNPAMSLDLNLSSILQNSKVILTGSVNGLLCLSQSVGHGGDNACICNPITREYMILHHRKDTWTFICGFGVVSMTGEYKVIRTFQDSNPTSLPRELEAEVYTLGTGQWRNIGHVPYSFDHSDQPFLNGHIHWRVDDEDSPESLCSFDLDKETFQLFPSPPSEAIEESYMHFQSLAVLKGCLCKSDTYDSQYTIWVMKEYGIKESWHKEVVVKLGIIPDLDWLIWEPMFLIEGLKDGSILMDYRRERLFVYCPQSKTIDRTEIFDPYFTGLAYRPSFLKLRDFVSERVYMF
ncbi:hypothetical protein OSB04_un000249 [Centaurea solstitialis]|uniref:F-box domain-containing protein n=1 Tax=Centaurea solstitialis TaxID=347529 RepID=A0AA38W2U2_9ASTR|nr:hypothetical protein OSB04_un000249 [Centaurea solstitialis]